MVVQFCNISCVVWSKLERIWMHSIWIAISSSHFYKYLKPNKRKMTRFAIRKIISALVWSLRRFNRFLSRLHKSPFPVVCTLHFFCFVVISHTKSVANWNYLYFVFDMKSVLIWFFRQNQFFLQGKGHAMTNFCVGHENIKNWMCIFFWSADYYCRVCFTRCSSPLYPHKNK